MVGAIGLRWPVSKADPLGRSEIGSIRKNMRIRVLISIVLIAGWVSPAGALVCFPHSFEAASHSHGSQHDGHEHSHGASDRGAVVHDHAGVMAPQHGGLGAMPEGAPICCSEGATSANVKAVVQSLKPRPKSISLLFPSRHLDLHRPMILPVAVPLRLDRLPLLPYARTHRPLLV